MLSVHGFVLSWQSLYVVWVDIINHILKIKKSATRRGNVLIPTVNI